jgi:hypothetical protein
MEKTNGLIGYITIIHYIYIYIYDLPNFFFKIRLPDWVQLELAGNRDPGFIGVLVPVLVSQNNELGYPGSGSQFWPKTGKPDRVGTPNCEW